MAEKDRITNPTMGSNELGSEQEERRGKGMPAGTDTQTQMAALSAQKKKEDEEKDEKYTPSNEPVIDEEVIIIRNPLDENRSDPDLP